MKVTRTCESEEAVATESEDERGIVGKGDSFVLDCADWLCHALLSTHEMGKFSLLATVLNGKEIPPFGRLHTRLLATWLWHNVLEQLDLSSNYPANYALRKRPHFAELEKKLEEVKDAFLKDEANEWHTTTSTASSPNAVANNPSGRRLKRPPFHGSKIFNKDFRYVLFLTRAQQKLSELLNELQNADDGMVNRIIKAFKKEWGDLDQQFDDCLAHLTPTKRSRYLLLHLPSTDGEQVRKSSAVDRILDILMDPSHPLSYKFLRKKIQVLLRSWSDAVLTKPVFVQLDYRPDSNACRFSRPGESIPKSGPASPTGQGQGPAQRVEAECEATWTDHPTDDDDKTLPIPDRRDGGAPMSDNVLGAERRRRKRMEKSGKHRAASSTGNLPNKQCLSPNSGKSTPAWRGGRFLSPDRQNGYDGKRRRVHTADESRPCVRRNSNQRHQGLRTSRSAPQKKPIDVDMLDIIDLWRDSDDESTSSLSSDDSLNPKQVKSAYFTPKKLKRESSAILSPVVVEILDEIQKDWEDSDSD